MHAPLVPVRVRTAYRPDIDGLRAIAVLAVLYFHYGESLPPAWRLPGGFTGVDVFFVISGFLITSKLNDDIAAGEFSVLGFYDRRIRRILPALIAMLALTLFAGKFLLMPGDYMSLGTSTAATAFGVSNYFFLTNTGYFDQTADLLPLLHTWSLAVEEQFYVVWPMLLLFIASGRRRINIAAILGAVVIIGFATSLVWFDTDPKAAFFSVAPRAWELVIGALLVFLPPLPRMLGEIATALGLALIAAGFMVVSTTSFPGAAAFYPCVGAALVIWPRVEQTTTGLWLGLLSPIGLISYSLYLWHWPVWVMFRIYINNGIPKIREAAALVLLSIIFAVLSYHFIERPFRKRRWCTVQSIRTGLTACMLIFCAGSYVNSAGGLPSRISPDAYDLRSLEAMWEWKCPHYMVMGGLDTVCNFGADWSTATKRYLLWGDSHAEHMAPLLAATLTPSDGVAVALYSRCPSSINTAVHENLQPDPDYNRLCIGYYQAAIKAIRNKEFDGVIMAGFWSGRIRVLYDAEIADGTIKGGLILTQRGLIKAIDDIGSAAPITIIGDIPTFDKDPVSCATIGSLLRSYCDPPVIPLQQFERRQGRTYEALRTVFALRPSINLILPGVGMCQGDTCISKIDGNFIYRDEDHIRRNLPLHSQAALASIMGLSRAFQNH